VPTVRFASPRKLPKAVNLDGRVVVLDVAFAGTGLGKSFKKSTGKLIRQLGDRLAAWVDHHDNALHEAFAADRRFFLAKKEEFGACPEMITPALIEEVGPVDTIVCHADLDGIYAAAKWILGGRQPYPGADVDARAVDTRTGRVGPIGVLIDHAFRAWPKENSLRSAAVQYLIHGCRAGADEQRLKDAAAAFAAKEAEALRLAHGYEVRGRVAVVEVAERAEPYDKTDLLLEGQKLASVSVVKQGPHMTVAAPFDSGWNLLDIMELGGGMPTRVSLGAGRLEELVAKINAAQPPKVHHH
jgi:hypothetical protein